MAEYIEREKLMRDIEKYHVSDGKFQHWVEIQLAADVAPVRHGRWERIGIKGKGLPIYPCCSVCGVVSAAHRSQWEGLQGPWKYCPACGAKMDGKRKENENV